MYFAALLARTEDGWEASDMELDDVESLSDLIDLARSAAVDDDTVVALIEQEDAWFGVVRVDGEEDPRYFVSNAAAAARSSYGSMLTKELLGSDEEDDELDELDLDGTEDGEEESIAAFTDEDADEDGERGAGSEPVPAGPLGDPRLLDDLGVTNKQLMTLDGDALSEIAESLGATEVLEAVR
ncbi:tRNA adenosine deaminase-associated protein [Streptomyces erythrochromogenes]|uniref:tRNA adenosine deaminase-associated protein n=1 Tax=Streptomyces erythrochromogenes TaxID=285574 RepID=UPI0033E5FC6F